MDSKGLGIFRAHKIIGEVFIQEKKIHYNNQFRFLKPKSSSQAPKSNVSGCQNKGNRFRVGRWKHLYPPEDRGKNHINASRRRSLCVAKYKTVPLQIYGNNVTGAKSCHFESKKARFSVALMASDVKANYTPTR